MNLRLVFSALFACFFMLSCEKSISINNPSANPNLDELKQYNVAYGTDSAYRMDVCLPKGRAGNTPVVILLHGAYWTTGTKETMTRWQDSFLRNHIAAININVRNADTLGVHYLDIVEDMHNAINYISAHSKEWGIRNSGYVLVGMNSGGHMALLYTHKYNFDDMIKAVIALAAPSDLTDDMYLSNMIALGKLKELEAITGKPYVLGTGVPAAYLDASPRFYPKKTPTLLIHGKVDGVVPFNQASAYQVILNNTKCYNRLFPLTAAGYDLNLTDPAVAGTVFKEMQNWCWQFGA